MRLVRANASDYEKIWSMQTEAFHSFSFCKKPYTIRLLGFPA